MNRRIISSILQQKFNSWCKSITDEKVRGLVEKNTIITGGSIVSLLLKEEVNDFDLYFTNFETTKAVAEYYVNKFNKSHEEKPCKKIKLPKVYIEGERVRILIESLGVIGENTIANLLNEGDELDSKQLNESSETKYRPVYLTDNAITLSDNIQLIIRFYGDPEEIHKNYDFVHCTNWWTSEDKHLELRPPALESILSKELYYLNSKYPVCAFIRCRKFIKRGWHINAGQMLKICLQINELDLSDISVLEDQLIGVDTAYFIQLIDSLKAERNKDPNFHINMPYVASLIDKIF